jgi:hypothetical protein
MIVKNSDLVISQSISLVNADGSLVTVKGNSLVTALSSLYGLCKLRVWWTYKIIIQWLYKVTITDFTKQ